MSYRHPRQTCPVCHRSVATPAGKFARHDPPDSAGVPGFLISCTGSLRQAPADGEQPLLFEVGAGAAGAWRRLPVQLIRKPGTPAESGG
ncbi:hypothetical protein, partial [Streptomyces albidoflavus]|uniref:hypothetical protein n=1 Tax=Streptomyces albidoflavus TaxID=1886 RepID=UPI000D198AA8